MRPTGLVLWQAFMCTLKWSASSGNFVWQQACLAQCLVMLKDCHDCCTGTMQVSLHVMLAVRWHVD